MNYCFDGLVPYTLLNESKINYTGYMVISEKNRRRLLAISSLWFVVLLLLWGISKIVNLSVWEVFFGIPFTLYVWFSIIASILFVYVLQKNWGYVLSCLFVFLLTHIAGREIPKFYYFESSLLNDLSDFNDLGPGFFLFYTLLVTLLWIIFSHRKQLLGPLLLAVSILLLPFIAVVDKFLDIDKGTYWFSLYFLLIFFSLPLSAFWSAIIGLVLLAKKQTPWIAILNLVTFALSVFGIVYLLRIGIGLY